jgi:RNA polymerase sigma-70 factor (ECF subfamily)
MTPAIVDEREALVRAAAGGDSESFGLLVEGCWDRLVRLARSMAGDLEAEDAVQESLLIAWHKLPQLDDHSRFDAWVTRITFRRCLRHFGLWRRRLARDSEQQRRASAAATQDSTVEVWSVLRRLAPRQRAVLHLTVVEGMTDTEVAVVLGIRAGSVRAHRRRARKHLARLLGSEAASAGGNWDVGEI